MTTDEVKANLPDIRIKIGKAIYAGRVSGRKNRFATIYVPDLGVDYEYAWQTIAHSINNDSPLLI